MSKRRITAWMLLAVFGLAQSTYAADKTTTVKYHVDPSYLIRIPADTTIPFNEETSPYGKIYVEEAQIDEGKCIQVSLLSDKILKNPNDNHAGIPYEILADGAVFTQARYTMQGEETSLTIAIGKDSWKKAAAGSYADTVTFEIAYVDETN